MAILDIHDLGLAREQGADIVGVMAFVQRPLAAVLAQPVDPLAARTSRASASASPACPSDDAVLRSIVAGDGGDPGKVRDDDDRLPGRQGAAGRAASRARRRSGTSRASRCSEQRPGDARVPRRRLRRARLPGAGAVRDARRRWRTTSRPSAPRSARCSAATARSQRDPESAVAAMVAAEPGLDQRRARRAARRRRARRSPPAPPAFGALRPARAARRGRAGTSAFGILERPLDVARRVRHVARRAFGALTRGGRRRRDLHRADRHLGTPRARRRPEHVADERDQQSRCPSVPNVSASNFAWVTPQVSMKS